MKKAFIFLGLSVLLLYNSAVAQNLPSYLPSNGLVGWWPFNGNANDESGNGNNGTVNGATLSSDRNGNVNESYFFNGSSYISVPSNITLNFQGDESFSISLWINLNGSQNAYAGLVSKMTIEGNPNASGYQFVVGNSSALNVLATEISQSSGGLAYNSNTNLQNGAWKNVICVFNRVNSSLKFYIDGVNDFEIYDAIIPNLDIVSSAELYFGVERGSNIFFHGNLDDIAIYNRALTQEEITALYTGTPVNGGGGNTSANPVPPGIPYQAVVRNANGQVAANTAVITRFTLHQNTADGAVEYQETHALNTDEFGLINTVFGTGTPVLGTFAGINWSNTTKFVQVEADQGAGYLEMGTQQLMSVPYAMYAANGPVGPQGPAGADGAVGATGPQGPIGLTGPAGSNGKNSLVKSTTEPAGVNCPSGGVKFEFGVDFNENEILDSAEVNDDITKFICASSYSNISQSVHGSQQYAGNGNFQFVVPQGISQIELSFSGASGGNGGAAYYVDYYTNQPQLFAGGGSGGGYGFYRAFIPVDPGDVLEFVIGENGLNAESCYSGGWGASGCQAASGTNGANSTMSLNGSTFLIIGGGAGGSGGRWVNCNGCNYGGASGAQGTVDYSFQVNSGAFISNNNIWNIGAQSILIRY